jgi:uncharacterized membrane protein
MLGSIALIALVVFAIVTHGRLNKLQEEIDLLKRRRAVTGDESVFSPDSIQADMGPQPEQAAPPSSTVPKLPPQPATNTAPEKKAKPAGPSFEERFGAQLPIWVGGIALAFGGFFLVRYSVEAGLIGPGLRVILALLFGLGLIAAAFRFGPSNMRMGQSLAGAGIAVLYASVYMASSFYNLVPSTLGFIGMLATTIGAVVMALRYGPPIALMGFVGALLTPIMVGGDGSTPLLLVYLYLALSGFLFVSRQQNWRWVMYLVVPAMLLWALIVAVFIATPAELPLLGAFLLAIYLTFARLNRTSADGQPSVGHILQHLGTTLGVTTLMGATLALSDYNPAMQVMFYLLILAALALSVFQRATYKIAPWPALALGVMAIATMPVHLALLPMSMMLLVLVAPFLIVGMWRAMKGPEDESFGWAMLSSIAGLAFYITAYLRFGYAGARVELWPFILPLLWGGLGLLGMALFTAAATRLNKQTWQLEKNRQYTLGTLACTASAFFTFGLAAEITALPIAPNIICTLSTMGLAGQMLALALINRRAKLLVLRPLIAVLGSVALFTFVSVLFAGGVHWRIMDLTILLALLAATRVTLIKDKDDKLVHCLDVALLALAVLLGWRLVSEIVPYSLGLWAHGLNVGVLAAIGLAGLLWAIKQDRVPLRYASLTALLLAAIALIGDMTISNPALHRYAAVGDLPLFNALLVLYLLPSVILYKASGALEKTSPDRFIPLSRHALRITAALGGFMFLNLSVRHLFHGSALGQGHTSNLELYSYSFLWLVIGIGLLVLGTLRQHKPLRIASLLLMIATVGKVFLIDAAELEGLLRVLSFMGLGVALMGLGWFYKRFIFTRDEV